MADQALLEAYFDRLWPLCRSITGKGLRDSLNILKEIAPLELHEVPSGTNVFDWTIPEEWAIDSAYLEAPNGKKVADFSKNNLHVVNYSAPVDETLSFAQLESHLHYRADLPTAIPYVTSYYKKDWGFCLSYNDFKTLPREGSYKAVIKSSFKPGGLTYGDLLLPGSTDQEILFSTYICHPSMANNELSGPLVTAFLAKKISELKNRKFSYRFLFAPETIGTLAYLQKHGNRFKEKLAAGYVVTCVGLPGPYTYKRSKRLNTIADKIAENLLKHSGIDYQIEKFSIGGSDERQFCSPGFNLPVGSLMRTPYKAYKEYHTSLDNKHLISFQAIEQTLDFYFNIARAFELNGHYKGTVLHGEPMLSKRDLYPASGVKKGSEELYDLLHFLTYADGETELIDIANIRGKSILDFEQLVSICKTKGLIL